MTQRTRVLLYLLLATVVVASCSEGPSPLDPASSDSQPALSVTATGCPTVDEVAAEVKSVVQQACPADAVYKNNGERNKCRREAFNNAIHPYKRCFNQGQISSIRRLVMHATPETHVRDGGDEIHDEPNPGQ
jgi:hypothetical protein